MLDLLDLRAADALNLTLTNSISVENDSSRVSTVGLLECLKCTLHADAKVVRALLALLLLNDTSAPVSGSSDVGRGTETEDRLLSEQRIVEHVESANHGWLVHEWQLVDSPRDASKLGAHLDQDLGNDGAEVLASGNGVAEDHLRRNGIF